LADLAWPFSEANLSRSIPNLLGTGVQWRNVPDDILVGALGCDSGASGFVLTGSTVELQRRGIDAARDLATVQRSLLKTIGTFNRETDKYNTRIERLTWLMAALALAQLAATFWPRGVA